MALKVEIKSGNVIDVLSNIMKMTDSLKEKIVRTFNIDISIVFVESTTLSHIKKNYKIVDMR